MLKLGGHSAVRPGEIPSRLFSTITFTGFRPLSLILSPLPVPSPTLTSRIAIL
jgi:hypothetical protein